MGTAGSSCCTLGPTPPVTKRLDTASAGGLEAEALDSWDFNALALAGDAQRIGLTALSLMQACAWSSGASDTDALGSLICGIQDGYLPNPFHNFAHAVDALQMVALVGGKLPWDELMAPILRMGLLIAALGHDIGHPGFSNVFLIDVQDDVALRYNDRSPLENMHCSRLFELLGQDRYNVFKHVHRNQFVSVRRMMIDAIIHTDAVNHDTVLRELETLYFQHADVFAPREGGGAAGWGLTPDQVEVLSLPANAGLMPRALLLTADFAAQLRCWEVAYPWASLLRDELTAQGDKERSLGLAVPPMHDRSTSSLPEIQLGLFHGWLVPFVCAEARLFGAALELCRKLSWNVRYWASRLEGAKAEDASPSSIADARAALLVSQLSDPRAAGATPRPQDLAADALKATSEAPPPTEPCSEPGCLEAAEGTPRPIVREIRRWQEVSAANPSCHRELVLLYVVGEESPGQPAPTGQPVLFRYTIAADHGSPGLSSSAPVRTASGGSGDGTLFNSWPGNPSPGSSQRPSLSQTSPSPAPVAQQAAFVTPEQQRTSMQTTTTATSSQGSFGPPQRAQAAMDSVCISLNSDRFDFFLEAVLEDIPGLLQSAREGADAKVQLEGLRQQQATQRRGSLRRSIVGAMPGVAAMAGALKAADTTPKSVGFR